MLAICSNRRRQRPQRYSDREFVEVISENEKDFESDDDIVGEAVYDEEYLRQRKQMKKLTSSSEGEGDEEYHWSDENGEDEVEEEEEEEEEDSLSISEDSDQPQARFKRPEGRTRRGTTKSRSVDGHDSGLRRSNRATRNRIDYRQYEISESDNNSTEQTGSRDSEGNDEEQGQGTGFDQPSTMDIGKDENQSPTKHESPSQDDHDGVEKRRFIDLNELAPGPGFEDGPSALVKDDDVKGE